MNKKKVGLRKKLVLNKEMVTALSDAEQVHIVGGILPTGCVISACCTQPKGMAACATRAEDCTTKAGNGA